MSANALANLTGLALTEPLVVQIRAESDAPVLARVSVSVADLADVASEGWRDGCLRTGHPDVPLAEALMHLSPILADGTDARCAGFQLELTLPNGKTGRQIFSISCLSPVAERAVELLLEADILRPGQTYTFEVVAGQTVSSANRPAEGSLPGNVALRSATLTYLALPLRELLERAAPVALLDAEEFPVFYTRDAFAKAEACARRGGQHDPPVESGGVLLGSLAACAISGEFCAIVRDVIEVQDALETTFSLSYSSQSWMRLQSILRARKAAFPRRAERLLGQAHGHSFKPNDGKRCAECAQRAVCSLTSVFVSRDDQNWHRAVFARQPWALCHIFGLTARGEPVHKLFGLKDGRLQARGFYVLPDFPFD